MITSVINSHEWNGNTVTQEPKSFVRESESGYTNLCCVFLIH